MGDTLEIISLLGKNFIQRKDVKAWQDDSGAWFPERKPMTLKDFEDHLSGVKTMGHYLIDQKDECKLFAFDIDIIDGDGVNYSGPHNHPVFGECTKQGGHKHPFYVKGEPVHLRKEWLDPESRFHENLVIQLRCMAEGLALRIARTLDVPVAIANSGGKGLHVYGLTGSLPASAVRNMALNILDGFGCFVPSRGTNFFRHVDAYKALEIEVFPKQDSLDGKDLGNLMSLPLGINRKTGRAKEFITCRAGYNGLQAMDPERALGGDLPWE